MEEDGKWGKQKVHQVTDVIIHPSVECIIFNSYKNLLKTASAGERKSLKQMQIPGYRKIVLDMIRKKTNPKADVLVCATQTLQNVVNLTMAARKAWGRAKLATVTKACGFVRMVVGNEDSEVAVGGGYYCQDCYTQPKNDFNWTVGKKCGVLSGWFCAHKGCPYDKKRMAGLVTFADKKQPQKSFVMNTRMPHGTTANLLAVMKLVNLIRNGECAFTAEDISKAGGVGKALKKLIGADNDRYFRSFALLRAVAVGGYIHAPNIGEHHCPEFEICEGGQRDNPACTGFWTPIHHVQRCTVIRWRRASGSIRWCVERHCANGPECMGNCRGCCDPPRSERIYELLQEDFEEIENVDAHSSHGVLRHGCQRRIEYEGSQ